MLNSSSTTAWRVTAASESQLPTEATDANGISSTLNSGKTTEKHAISRDLVSFISDTFDRVVKRRAHGMEGLPRQSASQLGRDVRELPHKLLHRAVSRSGLESKEDVIG